MSGLLDAEPLPRNVHEFTVSELAASLKRTIEEGYGHVRVRGEISGYRGPHSSGHCYFGLKDDRARLDAVIWRGSVSRLQKHLVEGLEVVATGRLSTFPGKSTYQIVVEVLEPAGVGALMAMLEERRQRLAAEGLFAAERKRPLPFLPDVIGVVTSPTGAVIRDILHRLSDRFPVHVLVWPVRVQGDASAAEVAAAIRGFNALEAAGAIPRPDLLIVARGGGSLEDLWSFNEESVVRAAAESAIPVISAVGHETDWTLLDMAADHRAPTPTAAAERAVPVRRDLIDNVDGSGLRLSGALARLLDRRRTELRAAVRGLGDAEDLVAFSRQGFDDLASRLPRALLLACREHRGLFSRLAGRLTWRGLARSLALSRERLMQSDRRRAAALGVRLSLDRQRFEAAAARLTPALALERACRDGEDLQALHARGLRALRVSLRERAARLESLGKLLDSLGYRNVLSRGFALVRDAEGRPLRSVAAIRPGARIDVELADGRFEAKVPEERRRKPVQIGLFGEGDGQE